MPWRRCSTRRWLWGSCSKTSISKHAAGSSGKRSNIVKILSRFRTGGLSVTNCFSVLCVTESSNRETSHTSRKQRFGFTTCMNEPWKEHCPLISFRVCSHRLSASTQALTLGRNTVIQIVPHTSKCQDQINASVNTEIGSGPIQSIIAYAFAFARCESSFSRNSVSPRVCAADIN